MVDCLLPNYDWLAKLSTDVNGKKADTARPQRRNRLAIKCSCDAVGKFTARHNVSRTLWRCAFTRKVLVAAAMAGSVSFDSRLVLCIAL